VAIATGPVKLGFAQYVIVTVTLLVVLPVIVWLSVPGSIHTLYLEQVVAPRLQREFGFEVGLVHLGPRESERTSWQAIARVVPGGVLDRAGMRRGDTGCLGVDTGGLGDIYAALELLKRETEVTVSLSNAATGRQPCRTVTIRRR
jgi:hypothetical protein